MKKILFIWLLFFPFLAISQKGNELYLAPSENKFDLVDYIYYLDDTSNSLTIKDIPQHKHFIYSKGELSFGLSQSTIWLKFRVRNSSKRDNFILTIKDPGIDHIQVYQAATLMADVGDKYPFFHRQIIDKNFSIRLLIDKNQTLDYYISIEKKGQTLSIPIELIRETYFYQINKNEYLFWGFFLGISFAFIVLNILTFLHFKEIVFLYSSAYILFFVSYCTTGLGFEYLWYNYPDVGFYDTGIAAMGTVSFHILFLQTFIKQSKSNKLLFFFNRFFSYLFLGGTLLGIGIVVFLDNILPSELGNALITTTMEVMILLYIILVIINIRDGYQRKQPYITYIVFSILAVICSMLLSLSVKIGWLYIPFVSAYIVPLGVLIDSLIITYAQYSRFNLLAHERNSYLSELVATRNQILQVQEDEQRRLAQDLHDDLGGTLSALKAKIINEPTNPQTINLAEKAIEDLRLIARNLLPNDLINDGLKDTIKQAIERMQNHSSIKFIYITFGTEIRMSQERELNIYRIISELLTNIVKHSKASKATVQVIYYQDMLHVLIEDNGIGIKTDKKNWGIGLKNVNSRIDFLKAKLLTDSSNNGTTFIIEIGYD